MTDHHPELPPVDSKAVEGTVFFKVEPCWHDEPVDDVGTEAWQWTVWALRSTYVPMPAMLTIFVGGQQQANYTIQLQWTLLAHGHHLTELEALDAGAAAAERQSATESRRNAHIDHPNHVSLNIDPTVQRKDRTHGSPNSEADDRA